MLKRIRLLDFKSFADEEIELAPLTLLVGANASGKSNFLDALWFLHGLTLGLDLDEVLDGEEPAHRNGEPWPGLRGGSNEASRFGATQFEISTTWGGLWGDLKADPDVHHRIACRTRLGRTGPAPRVISEFCWTADNEPGDRVVSEGLKSALGRQGSDDPGLPQQVGIRGLGFYHLISIRPQRMRDYGQLKRPHLAADGTNFSGALHHLCARPEERQALVDWLTELLAPEIVDVDFIEVEELGDVMAVFVEKDGTRVSARSLSDGTLRFLGLLLSLRGASRGSTFLIEEIDSGLHPARVHVLMDFLRQVTRDRDLQIIATTHAPTCLEFLDEEALRSTIVFGRVPEHEGTIMRQLGDLPHFDGVVKRKGLSGMFTTGWLEMAL